MRTLYKSIYADRAQYKLFHIYRDIAGRGSLVNFIYKVLLTNKVYLKVLYISAKGHKENANKRKMKERETILSKKWGSIGRRRRREVQEINPTACFNINLHAEFMIEKDGLSGGVVAACMRVIACTHVYLFLPRASLHAQTDV